MPRNAQCVRQWQVLQALQASAHLGRSLDELARTLNVHQRTIRRDLEVLQEVPFPLYCERDDAGRVRWRLLGKPAGLEVRL